MTCLYTWVCASIYVPESLLKTPGFTPASRLIANLKETHESGDFVFLIPRWATRLSEPHSVLRLFAVLNNLSCSGARMVNLAVRAVGLGFQVVRGILQLPIAYNPKNQTFPTLFEKKQENFESLFFG